jgi:hypothetical protein
MYVGGAIATALAVTSVGFLLTIAETSKPAGDENMAGT